MGRRGTRVGMGMRIEGKEGRGRGRRGRSINRRWNSRFGD
jgi:hypothetical protein